MGSPAYCSILPMYAFETRFVKRRTNSSLSAGARLSQVGPSERRDISWKSKSPSATLRMSARRSAVETFLTTAPFCENTCCTAPCTVSVGLAPPATPAAASNTVMIRFNTSCAPHRQYRPEPLKLRNKARIEGTGWRGSEFREPYRRRRAKMPLDVTYMGGGRGCGGHLAARVCGERSRPPLDHAHACGVRSGRVSAGAVAPS